MSDKDEVFAALRSDPALQRRAQQDIDRAKKQWLTGTAKPVAEDLRAHAAGAELAACAALSRVLSNLAAAQLLVDALIQPHAMVLNRKPFAHIPFRHQYQDGIAVLRLMEFGTAALSLVLYEQCDIPPARSVCFADADCVEIALAGRGEGRLFTSDDGGGISEETFALEAGSTLQVMGAHRTKMIDRVCGRLVVLRLTRTPAICGPSREYRLSDHRLIHRASGNRQESRQEMALALLGAMDRQDAVPTLAEGACEPGSSVRWQALRQCLAMDTAAGFRALCHIAADPLDPLTRPAQQLHVQLAASYPALTEMEAA